MTTRTLIAACLCFVATVAYVYAKNNQELTGTTFVTSGKPVELRLKINHEEVGLQVDISKKVPQFGSGFDAIRRIVTLEFTHHPNSHLYITELCGIPAPNGHYWAFSVDGKPSTQTIDTVRTDKNTTLEFAIKKQ